VTQIEVEFKIHGEGNLHGDGFAMWLTKQRATQGPVFGSTDNFEGLGIFFDTYKNNRPGTSFPYVMAMMGDGKTPYDQAHDGKANEVAGCSVSLPVMLSRLIAFALTNEGRLVVCAALQFLPRRA
jgi:mannose-binding lectin 2